MVRKKVLVLDLDETLVHYYEVKGEGSFRIRPGCEKFLKEMAEIYEVVIFTAASVRPFHGPLCVSTPWEVGSATA